MDFGAAFPDNLRIAKEKFIITKTHQHIINDAE
jgi:hypothetical protein